MPEFYLISNTKELVIMASIWVLLLTLMDYFKNLICPFKPPSITKSALISFSTVFLTLAITPLILNLFRLLGIPLL